MFEEIVSEEDCVFLEKWINDRLNEKNMEIFLVLVNNEKVQLFLDKLKSIFNDKFCVLNPNRMSDLKARSIKEDLLYYMNPDDELYSQIENSLELDCKIDYFYLPETYQKDICLIDYVNNERFTYICAPLIKEYFHRNAEAVYHDRLVQFDKIVPILLIDDIYDISNKDGGLLRRMKVINFLE